MGRRMGCVWGKAQPCCKRKGRCVSAPESGEQDILRFLMNYKGCDEVSSSGPQSQVGLHPAQEAICEAERSGVRWRASETRAPGEQPAGGLGGTASPRAREGPQRPPRGASQGRMEAPKPASALNTERSCVREAILGWNERTQHKNRQKQDAPGHGTVSPVWLRLDGTGRSAKDRGSDHYTGPETPRLWVESASTNESK